MSHKKGSFYFILTLICNNALQFLSQRVVNRWNILSEDDVGVPSMDCFKNRLEKRRGRQMDFFKDP